MKDFVDSINPALVLLGSSLSLVATMLSILLVRMQWKLEQEKKGGTTTTIPRQSATQTIALVFVSVIIVFGILLGTSAMHYQASQKENSEPDDTFQTLVQLSQEVDKKFGTTRTKLQAKKNPFFEITFDPERQCKEFSDTLRTAIIEKLKELRAPENVEVKTIRSITLMTNDTSQGITAFRVIYDAELPPVKTGGYPQKLIECVIAIEPIGPLGNEDQAKLWAQDRINEFRVILKQSAEPINRTFSASEVPVYNAFLRISR